MHILILGGSGRTGQYAIDGALARSHTVTALVRTASKLTPREHLTIVTGVPTDPAAIATAFASPQAPAAVLIALSSASGGGLFGGPPDPRHFMADTFAVVANAMAQHGVKKVVALAAFGVGDSNPQMNFVFRALFQYTALAYAFEDHNAVEAEARRRADLDWVLVRANMLGDGEKQNVRVWGDQGVGMPAMAKVSRKSVAGFMLDAVEGEKWNRGTPVISN